MWSPLSFSLSTGSPARGLHRWAILLVLPILSLAAGPPAALATGEATPSAAGSENDRGWPRVFRAGNLTLSMYQPQVEEFNDAVLRARAAVAVDSQGETRVEYGVIWIRADVDVDKDRGLVDLTNIQITKANFPAARGRQEDYLKILRNNLSVSRTISLARIEANLAMTAASPVGKPVSVRNNPPRIIHSEEPALLVLIDGKPVWRPVPDAGGLARAVNTRALLLFDPAAGRYAFTIGGRWLSADRLDGRWELDPHPSESAESLRRTLASRRDTGVDLLENPQGDVKAILASGHAPSVYVSTEPAELIVTRGRPQMQPVLGTGLLWVQNTESDLFFQVDEQAYYVVISGRWLRSRSLSGPWEFVPGDRLPEDFARIPEGHPKARVLAAVAATPAAREAVIADSIPQTARVRRSEAKLEVRYDGEPRWESIEGTALFYARNSPTPVIQVARDLYFAVEDGIWFTSASPSGPWAVATEIPAVIYTIPPSSPVFFVTYVRVYRSTEEDVWVGYTPGYLGSCLAPWGTVVYGTGWDYEPWIGEEWVGYPWTWGFAVTAGWGWDDGWWFGDGGGWWYPWWNPFCPGYYPGSHPWEPERPAINQLNVYDRHPRAVVSRPPSGAGAIGRPAPLPLPARPAPPGSRVEPRPPSRPASPPRHGDIYAGPDGSVYRPSGGGWEVNDGKGWTRMPPQPAPAPGRPSPSDLSRERQGRQAGEARSVPRAPSAPPRAAPPPRSAPPPPPKR